MALLRGTEGVSVYNLNLWKSSLNATPHSHIDTAERPGLENRCEECFYGLFGVFKLVEVSYLVLIKDRVLVGTIASDKIWKMTEYSVYKLSPSDAQIDEIVEEKNQRYLKMIRRILDGCSFIYSYDRDITRSVENTSNLDKKLDKASLYIESFFCWNLRYTVDIRKLIHKNKNHDAVSSPSLDVQSGFTVVATNFQLKELFTPFLLNIACGYARTFRSLIGKKLVELTLVSKIGKGRAGIRYHSRGASEDGFAANFVETEQILHTSDGDLMSFIQIRGSIPLLWKQNIDGRYNPTITFSDNDDSYRALKNHFDSILPHYKKVHAICLLDRHKRESSLGRMYEEGIKSYNSNDLSYTSFDFHSECSNMRWENISILIENIRSDMESKRYFHVDGTGKIICEQNGVYRTNCLDCIDRTNVVQREIAKAIITSQLKDVGIFSKYDKVGSSFPELDYLHRTAWADNADVISRIYTGTSALKTDFTRLNKRTIYGAITDIVKSCIRYYRNNYMDGYLQDSLVLFTGRFDPRLTPLEFFPPNRSLFMDIMPVLKIGGLVLAHHIISKKFLSISMPLADIPTYLLTLGVVLMYFFNDIASGVDLPKLSSNIISNNPDNLHYYEEMVSKKEEVAD